MLLFELSRSSPLYHWLDSNKIKHVLAHDEMLGKWEHYMPVEGKTFQGNSLSRNSRLDLTHTNVRFTFNQAKLAARFKIIPVDGSYVYHGKGVHAMTNPIDKKARLKHLDHMRDRTFQADQSNYSEEFVIGDIKQVHLYIDEIKIVNKNRLHYITKPDINEIKAYAEKFNIKFVPK
jgi:hypothetical protein